MTDFLIRLWGFVFLCVFCELFSYPLPIFRLGFCKDYFFLVCKLTDMWSKLVLAICLVKVIPICSLSFVVLWSIFGHEDGQIFFFTFIQADLLIVYASRFCVFLTKTFFMPRLIFQIISYCLQGHLWFLFPF